MNDAITSAIMLTTVNDTDNPAPVAFFESAAHEHANQLNYRGKYDRIHGGETGLTEEAKDGVEQVPGNNADIANHVVRRINEDDVTWINAGEDNDAFNGAGAPTGAVYRDTVFNYTRVYNLYQFSENLESWCKRAQAYVRANQAKFRCRGYTYTKSNGNAKVVPPHAMNEHDPTAHNDTHDQAQNAAEFTLRITIAPDWTLRVFNTHPRYVGLQFHKAFRTIYKMPRFLDCDIHMVKRAVDAQGGVVPSPEPFDMDKDILAIKSPLPEYTFHAGGQDVNANHRNEHSPFADEATLQNATPEFIPQYGFQDCYHRLKSFIITSDLPTAGECSMNGVAMYRILSDFKYTPSTGLIESSAAKKMFLSTDTNYISEAPPGNVDFFAANGTHSRIILMRGSYPMYSCLLSVVTHNVQ